MGDVNFLQEHLHALMPKLFGPWVKLKNGYDRDLAVCLGMEFSASRYWDARWNTLLLEFKKGKNIWLDLVRYSEVFLRVTDAAGMKTQTLFFLPDQRGESIVEVACVASETLIEFLGLSDESLARSVLAIKERVPHSLNAQANLTWRDVRSIQRFGIRREPPKERGRNNFPKFMRSGLGLLDSSIWEAKCL